jgi:hypothetical protein
MGSKSFHEVNRSPRTGKKQALAAALLFFVSTLGSSASAEPPVRDALTGEARESFDEGAKLYRDKRLAQAREAFAAAFAKSNDPRVLFNVAVCEKALGRYARAVVTLERSLALIGPSENPEYTERARSAIATISQYVGKIAVEAKTDGLSVTIDGEPVRERVVTVEIGEHVVEARREGFESETRKVSLAAGETVAVAFALKAIELKSSASISCPDAPSCAVEVDGERLGQGPVAFNGAPGSYIVRATVGGQPYAQERLQLEPGRVAKLSLTGRQLPRLRVSTDRIEDAISVDGVFRGSGSIEMDVFPGEHRLSVSRPGAATKTMELALRERETRDLRLSLTEERTGISTWWFVGGGVVLAGAAAATVFAVTRPTQYEGASAGALNPGLVPATFGGSRR